MEKAQQLFEMIIRNDENYLAAYYQLGKLQELKGEIPAAINTLKAGQQKATAQKNRKAAGEFEEAIFMLED
jgi:tetratricopeptide (TPR) repeat protein